MDDLPNVAEFAVTVRALSDGTTSDPQFNKHAMPCDDRIDLGGGPDKGFGRQGDDTITGEAATTASSADPETIVGIGGKAKNVLIGCE